MKVFGLLLFVLGSSLGFDNVIVESQTPHYTMTPVLSPEDKASCAKSSGKAAYVADLSAEGELTSDWSAVCLLLATD